ncbi:unnamed protein product [Bathycoccus prasinos]
MFASTTASTHISCSQLARSQRKSSNTRMASSATSSSSSSSFSSSFETRRLTKLNVARKVREAKGANERGMAILAKATAESSQKKEAVCYLRNVHMSPFKVRRVLDCIRGKSYEECLIMLEFMPYRACEPILSALFSAASNAKNNLGMNKAKLYVSECYADGAGTMKRFHPRAQGRPFPIRKRTCSITLKMKEQD